MLRDKGVVCEKNSGIKGALEGDLELRNQLHDLNMSKHHLGPQTTQLNIL